MFAENKSRRGKRELSGDQASPSDIFIMSCDRRRRVTLAQSTQPTSRSSLSDKRRDVLLPIQQHLAAPVSSQTARRHLLSQTPPPLSPPPAGDVAQPVPVILHAYRVFFFLPPHPPPPPPPPTPGQRRRVTADIRESSACASLRFLRPPRSPEREHETVQKSYVI